MIKNGANVTTSANPLVLTKNITLTVIDCCAPPPIRLAAHCIEASAFIVALVESIDTVTIGSAINLISKIYENC